MEKSRIHYITKFILDVFFFAGIAALFAVYPFTKWWTGNVGHPSIFVLQMTAALLLSGACSIYIVAQLRQMFKTMLSGNPFVQENITCFRKMAVASCIITIIYTVKCFVYFTVVTAVITLTFAIATLFCLTLKDLFKQAVAYKEENDWTV